MKKQQIFLKTFCSKLKKLIIVFVGVSLLQLSAIAQQDKTTISGLITSSLDGSPIIGASIVVPGTTRGVVSNVDGDFSIVLLKGDSLLTISFIGFLSETVSVKNQTNINIVLAEDIMSLSEVVVVGYGTQKKSDLTGAIAVVDVDEVVKRSVATVDQALQGQVAGVSVTSNSGSPGSGIMVRVRGTGTIHEAAPLFVIDGMMVDNADYINSNDIESMQVLKDASATAIYGSRGANGVVLITTKKGQKGGRISFNSYYGVQNFWRSGNVLDSKSWATLRNEAMVAAGNSPPISEDDFSSLPNTNWLDEVSNKNAVISNFDLSASGGSDKGNYFFSINSFGQEGLIQKTNFNRTSFRVNSSYKVKPWLKVGENISLIKETRKKVLENEEYAGIIISSLSKDPATTVLNPYWVEDDGSQGYYNGGIYNDIYNPAASIAYTNHDNLLYRTIGNIYAEIEFMKDFVFRTSYSLEYSFGDDQDYIPVYSVYNITQGATTSRLSINKSNRFVTQWTNTVNYQKTIGEHNFSALFGFENYGFDYGYNGMYAFNIPSDNPDIRFMDNATGKNAAVVNGSVEQVRMLSYLGRVNYSLKNKYLITANFRADASSKFPKKNRWGYFPSFSAGWKISDESFLNNVDFLNFLKLRAGWGKIGNQGSLAPYADVTTASSGTNYIWGGILAPGTSFKSIGNPELKWETSTTTNIGLDYGFFRGKLSGSIEYFIKNTTDMIVQAPVPGQVGVESSPWQNVGEMKNSGVEFSAIYKNMENKFKYSLGVNFSKVENKVISLGAEGGVIDAGYIQTYNVSRTEAGYPIAQFYGRKTDGLFQTQAEIDNYYGDNSIPSGLAPGDVKYVLDENGKEKFFRLGSPLPNFTYAFNTNFMYESFDLNIMFQGVQGNKIFNGTSHYIRSSTANWNLSSDMTNRWTGEGSQNNARYPRMNANDGHNNKMSDRFIEDGSYLRVKTVQLGYTLNTSLTEKLRISKFRIYINAQNLFTFTKYSGLDPEIGNTEWGENYTLQIGVDRGYYPQARMYSMGVNLTF